MKKLSTLLIVIFLSSLFLNGCGKPEQAVTPEKTDKQETVEDTQKTETQQTEESQVPQEPEASFVIDYEDESVLALKTVCFDEEFTKSTLSFTSTEGMSGKALKGIVKEKEAGNTWWVMGTGFIPEYTQKVSFKDLERITFKYKSTVQYNDEIPFIVRLVWKDIRSGESVANLKVDFPVEKTSEVKVFEISIPQEIKDTLNNTKYYYLDWVMIGLTDKAEDLFNPGTIYIDDIKFFADANYVPEDPPEIQAFFTIDYEDESVFAKKTVSFDEEFTKSTLAFTSTDGMSGKALKAIVKEKEAGNTWWVMGNGFKPDYTKDISFKDLKRVTFKYKSTVQYNDEIPFIVQMVWKNVESGEGVATMRVDFPIEKTSDVKTFEILVPEEVTTNLNNATGYYFDWLMIGLTDKAEDLFNPGTIYIDDISFYNE